MEKPTAARLALDTMKRNLDRYSIEDGLPPINNLDGTGYCVTLSFKPKLPSKVPSPSAEKPQQKK